MNKRATDIEASTDSLPKQATKELFGSSLSPPPSDETKSRRGETSSPSLPHTHKAVTAQAALQSTRKRKAEESEASPNRRSKRARTEEDITPLSESVPTSKAPKDGRTEGKKYEETPQPSEENLDHLPRIREESADDAEEGLYPPGTLGEQIPPCFCR